MYKGDGVVLDGMECSSEETSDEVERPQQITLLIQYFWQGITSIPPTNNLNLRINCFDTYNVVKPLELSCKLLVQVTVLMRV